MHSCGRPGVSEVSSFPHREMYPSEEGSVSTPIIIAGCCVVARLFNLVLVLQEEKFWRDEPVLFVLTSPCAGILTHPVGMLALL